MTTEWINTISIIWHTNYLFIDTQMVHTDGTQTRAPLVVGGDNIWIGGIFKWIAFHTV